MANKRTGPESARRTEPEADVEAHGRRLDTKATPPDEPGTQPESGRRTGPESESDVEGHNFGHNVMLSRQAAQSRESEIQRNLRQHEIKGEARRPFFKKKGG
jgi:hypothetical protein